VKVLSYVDDILVISERNEDRQWVKSLLEAKYEKVTSQEGDCLPYLGMTILKTSIGYKICMRAYIEDMMKLYGKDVRECVTTAKQYLFDHQQNAPVIQEREKFHLVVAKLLYLGKRGRPDSLMPVQFLCTRVRNPMADDQRKLERVLGYLKMTKTWTWAFSKLTG